MAFELRELQGNIFTNKYKESDKQPDMKGDLLLNGVPHEIAIWNKTGAKGPFLGFKISEKRVKDEQKPVARREDPISSGRLPPRQNILPDDEEIPF